MKQLLVTGFKLDDTSVDTRYNTFIMYANRIREVTGFNEVMAMLGCGAIKSLRSAATIAGQNKAYILDQFKRPEEIRLLRNVYGSRFILISLYSDRERRIDYLAHRMSRYQASRPTSDHRNAASVLVKRDEDEQGETFGQRLSDTFAMADLFLNIDDEEGSKILLSRFLDGLFGSNAVSPSKDEYGIYIATSAALRSLDLSRQVGAATFSKNGEVITQGCNEVPKAGGGTYWNADFGDARDYTLEGDQNDRIKRELLLDVVVRLNKEGLTNKSKSLENLKLFVLKELSRKGSGLKEAQLMDLLEYGRIIHAEMSAISDAARLGRKLKGTSLYCTTFPCHICAKHIVASGIKKVIFIEPYPKSYAEELHSDSILVGITSAKDKRVRFTPFIGIAPYRFKEIFTRGRRKDAEGDFEAWREGSPKLTSSSTLAACMENEIATLAKLNECLQAKNVKALIKPVSQQEQKRDKGVERNTSKLKASRHSVEPTPSARRTRQR